MASVWNPGDPEPANEYPFHVHANGPGARSMGDDVWEACPAD